MRTGCRQNICLYLFIYPTGQITDSKGLTVWPYLCWWSCYAVHINPANWDFPCPYKPTSKTMYCRQIWRYL